MAGLPKQYAKMGFKKGWREYKKTAAYKRKTGKPVRRAAPRKAAKPRRRTTRAAPRKSRRSGSMKRIHLGATLGIIGTGYAMFDKYRERRAASNTVAESLRTAVTAIDNSGNFHPDLFKDIYLPMGVGIGASFIAGKTGVNRYLPKGINI